MVASLPFAFLRMGFCVAHTPTSTQLQAPKLTVLWLCQTVSAPSAAVSRVGCRAGPQPVRIHTRNSALLVWVHSPNARRCAERAYPRPFALTLRVVRNHVAGPIRFFPPAIPLWQCGCFCIEMVPRRLLPAGSHLSRGRLQVTGLGLGGEVTTSHQLLTELEW